MTYRGYTPTQLFGTRALAPVLLFSALAFFSARAPSAADSRLSLAPHLQAGQTLVYLITFSSNREIQTRSSVVIPQAPPPDHTDLHVLLRLQVLGVEAAGNRAVIRARAVLQPLPQSSGVPGALPENPDASPSAAPPPHSTAPAIEFTLFPDGRAEQLQGLDALPPDLQVAWHQWLSRFTVAADFPSAGIHTSGKWKSDQPENSSAPVARLRWLRESTYVRDESCRPPQLTAQGRFTDSTLAPDTCAVILTTSLLKQDSSPKDATPDDFRLRQLRTSGTARGSNAAITYISRATGLVVRASEDASQSMDVTISTVAGSNRVHYGVAARSHSEILLITEAPASAP